MRRTWHFAALLLAAGCFASDDPETAEPVTAEVTVGADGRSEEVSFEIPEGARSLTVVVEGAPSAFVALASLELADGSSPIALDGAVVDALASAGRSRYPMLPGAVPQFVRQGTFAWLYPRVAEQPLPAGPARLRAASTDGDGRVTVSILTPPDDGAHVLHVAIASASDHFSWTEPPAAMGFARDTFARAGIDLVVDDVVALDGQGVGPFEPEAYPTPDGPEVALLRRARAQTDSDGLLLMFVDAFDAIGYTLGLPGPPVAGADYAGVLVSDRVPGAGDPAAKLGHVVAHEIAHNLGLTHLFDYDANDREVPDAFDDTGPDDRNLMGSLDLGATPTEQDTALTPRQRWALLRSAMLVAP